MSLKVGIVGLPNVGKSTLFNALLKRQQAYVANFPFATIEPNVGVVPVPDSRLQKLAEIVASENSKSQAPNIKQVQNSNYQNLKLPPIVPATVQFVDIAGLVAGAHKGEGLGNKFLSYIREVDAICHVLRLFKDNNILRVGDLPLRQGFVGQAKSDFETVKTELDLADLEMVDRASAKASSGKEKQVSPDLPLFSKKPILVVLNVDEGDLAKSEELAQKYADELGISKDQIVVISAKTEAELAELSPDEQKAYLADLGVSESGLERLAKKAFATLDLITFLTAGEKEVRAWTVRLGSTALTASGTIHTDFVKKFIKAEVVSFEDFVAVGGWKKARELGKTRFEGADYIIKDGDVVEFKIGA